MPPWICAIKATAVRGISRTLELTWTDAENASSLLLLGDNGSGKSSIVDALQFALQAEAQGLRGTEAVELIRSHGAETGPAVATGMSDGGSVERRVVDDPETGPQISSSEAVSSYARTPLVLRRSDILHFWTTPSTERQLVFARYFRPERAAEPTLPRERSLRLQRELALAESQLRTAVQRLSGEGNVAPRAEGSTASTLERWVTSIEGRSTSPQAARLADATRRAATRVERARADLSALESGLIGDVASDVRAALEGGGAFVAEAFARISPSAPVDEVEIRLSGHLGLDVTVVLSNGARANPSTALSEANRDLLALLIFVWIAQSAAERLDQARVIVLDDVFQSGDAPVRVAALDYLLEVLPGWQFVLTVHDRLWREQIVSMFRRHGQPLRSFEIISWSLSEGPRLRESSRSPTEGLSNALDSGDPAAIAAGAGHQLEHLCQGLSWRLPIRVVRRHEDRYTLADLWPGVYSSLKRTSVKPIVDEVDRYLHLRNLLGAHYNEWAQSASLEETRRLGRAVDELARSVVCDSCGRWIEPTPTKHTWSCRCGATIIARPPK